MRETNKSVSVKSPSLLKQAMSVNRKPFPWVKAFCAGVAAALPVIIGLLFGKFRIWVDSWDGGIHLPLLFQYSICSKC